MYILIDPSEVPQFANLEDAIAERDRIGTGEVFGTVESPGPEALERLYGLCGQLLKVSGINPMKLEMELTNLLGEETVVSAARIMVDARNFIDGAYHAD